MLIENPKVYKVTVSKLILSSSERGVLSAVHLLGSEDIEVEEIDIDIEDKEQKLTESLIREEIATYTNEDTFVWHQTEENVPITLGQHYELLRYIKSHKVCSDRRGNYDPIYVFKTDFVRLEREIEDCAFCEKSDCSFWMGFVDDD